MGDEVSVFRKILLLEHNTVSHNKAEIFLLKYPGIVTELQPSPLGEILNVNEMAEAAEILVCNFTLTTVVPAEPDSTFITQESQLTPLTKEPSYFNAAGRIYIMVSPNCVGIPVGVVPRLRVVEVPQEREPADIVIDAPAIPPEVAPVILSAVVLVETPFPKATCPQGIFPKA